LIRKLSLFVPAVSSVLLRSRFRSLNGKRIHDLFNMSILAPSELKRRVGPAASGNIDLRGMTPSAHLAVFRLIKERGKLNEEGLDALMTQWLLKLASKGTRSTLMQ
jgi:hypothetical protein